MSSENSFDLEQLIDQRRKDVTPSKAPAGGSSGATLPFKERWMETLASAAAPRQDDVKAVAVAGAGEGTTVPRRLDATSSPAGFLTSGANTAAAAATGAHSGNDNADDGDTIDPQEAPDEDHSTATTVNNDSDEFSERVQRAAGGGGRMDKRQRPHDDSGGAANTSGSTERSGAAWDDSNTAAYSQNVSQSQGGTHYSHQGSAFVDDEYSESHASRDRPAPVIRPPSAMYYDAVSKKLAREQWAALQRARLTVLEEARDRRQCPFAPQLSPHAAEMHRPKSLAPHNRVHRERRRKVELMSRMRQERIDRELEECTFQPLTLRAARMLPGASIAMRRARSAASEGKIHSQLFHYAEAQTAFRNEVRNKAVQTLEGEVLHKHVDKVLTPDEMAAAVRRLVSQATVATLAKRPHGEGLATQSPRTDEDSEKEKRVWQRKPSTENYTFHPEINKESERILAELAKTNPQSLHVIPHVVERLRSYATGVEPQLHEKEPGVDQPEEKTSRRTSEGATVRTASSAGVNAWLRMPPEVHAIFREEWTRSVLRDKSDLILRGAHAASLFNGGSGVIHVGPAQHIHKTNRYSVVELARVAAQLLTTAEADNVITIMKAVRQEALNRDELRAAFERFVFDGDGMDSALATIPPPPARVSSTRRDGGISEPPGFMFEANAQGTAKSSGYVTARDRYRDDPGLKDRVVQRRLVHQEKLMREQIVVEEMEQRKELTTTTFYPGPRRLIPRNCRPDVQIALRTTRADMLRRSAAIERLDRIQRLEDGDEASPSYETQHVRGVKMQSPSPPPFRPSIPAKYVVHPVNAGAALTPHYATQLSNEQHSSRPKRGSSTEWKTVSSAAKPTTQKPPQPGGRTTTATAAKTVEMRNPPSYSSKVSSIPANETGSDDASIDPYAFSSSSAEASVRLHLDSTPRQGRDALNAAFERRAASRGETRSPRTRPQARVYRDVIAEHAAIGGPDALSALGRELAFRQLQKYRGNK